ncbi:MAG: cobaltochelatase subunit CobN, partial [Actinobacteria bacterium]|nr:cobaltochelatase subunit CobN [Actinomycetota bacterium]
MGGTGPGGVRSAASSVRPVWARESRRVTGIEVIPLEELGRPRIDVT